MTLSAKKEEIRLAASAAPGELPTFDSFGKVVSSIQGLQQRLENFTADDVGEAHAKTQTLLLSLSDMQRKLARFAEIKQSLAAVRAPLEQALSDCAELAKVDAIEQPLSMQTLTQANKLIQFPRLNKLAKISQAAGAGEADESATPPPAVEIDSSPPSDANEEVKETVNVQASETNTPVDSVLQPAANSQIMDDAVIEQEHGAPDRWSLGEEEPSPLLAVDPVVTPHFIGPDTEVEQPPIPVYDPESSPSSEINADSLPSVSMPEAPANEGDAKKAFEATTSTDFDQRLLDDLIKNYGEFTASLRSSRAVEVPDTPTVEAIETNASAKVETIEVEPEIKNLPTTRKDGDLDRQLKKIIKDYGEYDLYSRQSPINIKTGVIAAFVLLGLIFSGFYFFSPKAVSSQNAASEATNAGAVLGPSPSSTLSNERENSANRPAAAISGGSPPRATDSNPRLKGKP